jgi:phosphoesterase RecJ-like protein
MNTVAQAAKRISEADNTLIVCHFAPDGDAIGSLLGLGLALREKGQRVTMMCADPIPVQYHYLPQWQAIATPQVDAAPTPEASDPVSLIVSLDCGDLARLGKAYDPESLKGVPIINIDHHATNVNFGEINWVDPTAAATAQMLVPLIRALKVPLTRDIATCLLTGILTDTLGFRTATTTPQVMATSIELMNTGASLTALTDQIFNHRPMETIRMWTMALQNLHLEGRILWSEITQRMRERVGYTQNGDAGLASFLSTANEADIAIVFDELGDGRVNVSMRASPGYDISKVAFRLGGGGHPQAAGCTLPRSLSAVKTQVLSLVQQAWNEQTREK